MTASETKSPSRTQEAWFCTTGLPSDVVVEVGDVTFHLHRFPLMAKSKKLLQLISEQEGSECGVESGRDGDGDRCEDGGEKLRITLPQIPGGAEAFETAAKFCYGVKTQLTAANAVPVHCAAEHLGMTEDLSHDNLISRSDRYISQSVCRSVRESVRALRSCGELPEAEDLGIVQRCVDAIAAIAADPASFLGWPVEEAPAGSRQLRRRGSGSLGSAGDPSVAKAVLAEAWCEELTGLGLPIFMRVIAAMKARDLSPDIIEGCLFAFARKSIPGLSRSVRKCGVGAGGVPAAEQIQLLEAVIENLPAGRSAKASSSGARLLFGMLRIASILCISNKAREALERKIGAFLDLAVVDDLLMPSYSSAEETLYDVDCVERLLGYFLEGIDNSEEGEVDVSTIGRSSTTRSVNPMLAVGKLVDRYLSEIASDANLKPDKFCALAFALPERARVYEDGLYRAVDVYLKAHPQLAEAEREKLCGVMDCQKLTLEACTHAAQNERLPLRAIVQVLFFEQLQLRNAIAGSLLAPGGSARQPGHGRVAWEGAAARGGDQVLRLDMDSMRSRVQVLEQECSTMKKAIEKIDRISVRGSVTRRLGCKFRTQVCDSHERTIVEATRSRASEEQHQGA